MADYEGQAAMELETLARCAMKGQEQPVLLDRVQRVATIEDGHERIVLQQQQLVLQLLELKKEGVERADIALDFHISLIHSLVQLLEILSRQTGLKTVVLGGGCM